MWAGDRDGYCLIWRYCVDRGLYMVVRELSSALSLHTHTHTYTYTYPLEEGYVVYVHVCRMNPLIRHTHTLLYLTNAEYILCHSHDSVDLAYY